ncbi:MAG: type II toxin-antitoxin system RelE/ParE family toxin [Synergistaceae bacterium]|nr:type II toxin-antitoxin system RelE/ParE family toxin [Synergistaceae bacterium]
MGGFEVIFYQKASGEEPAQEFILSLDNKMRAKINSMISLLEDNGTELRKPYSEHLEDGIFELRVKFASNISHVLYFFVSGKRIILTHGFIKKTQKTPRMEIDRAKIYRDDYLNRGNN